MPDPLTIVVIVCALFAVILPFLLPVGRKGKEKRTHVHNRRRARRAERKIRRRLKDDAGRLGYLRSLDPFVFEELVLDAFERRGFRIRRNSRYTADGGVDGRVIYRGRTYFVQCKRYSGYIDPEDVRQFTDLCSRAATRGYFVHAGLTGAKCRELTCDSNVRFIDGSALINMIVL